MKRCSASLIGLVLSFVGWVVVLEPARGAIVPIKTPTLECRLIAGCDDPQLLLNQIASWGIAIGDTLFFFMFLWGGFQYLTGSGNESETTKAKTTMIAAVVGLLLVTGAWAILKFFILGVTQG